MKFRIALFLDRFKKAEVIKYKVDGRMLKGVFIPFRHNNVYATKYGYIAYLNVSEIQKSRNGNTHFIHLYVPKKLLEAIKRGEEDRLKTLGYMAPRKTYRRGSYNLVGDGHFDAALAVDSEEGRK